MQLSLALVLALLLAVPVWALPVSYVDGTAAESDGTFSASALVITAVVTGGTIHYRCSK